MSLIFNLLLYFPKLINKMKIILSLLIMIIESEQSLAIWDFTTD